MRRVAGFQRQKLIRNPCVRRNQKFFQFYKVPSLNRHDYSRLKFFDVLLSIVLGLQRVSAASTNQPNIIFILADDLGYGDLGVLFQNSRAPGLPKEATPNLDAFAAEGIQLRQHYCPAPLCAPSRASLLLGVHQGHANVRNDQFEKHRQPFPDLKK